MKTRIIFALLSIIVCTTQLSAQDRVVVFDFNVNSGMTNETAITLTNKFRSEIAKTKKYTMVERSAMEQVMSEQRFSVSDLADQEKAIELGKLLSASKVVVGDIDKIGQTYSIFLRLIDTQTGSIENTETLEYRGAQDGLLVELEVLAQKLSGTYVKKKKRGWLYATGVAILGGAAAGYLLLGDDGGDGTLPRPPSPPNN